MRSMEEALEKLAEPLLKTRGLRLVDLELKRQGGRLWVRFFVDRQDLSRGGITLSECEDFNLAFSRQLDAEDLIPESYLLEVSSPGVNRRLRRLEDFQTVIGKTVTVMTGDPWEGKKKFRGRLESADDEAITVEADGRRWRIPLTAIARANLEYDWGERD